MALYDDVLNIAKSYLGPAAEKFIARQLSAHLMLNNPNEVAPSHLNELARWCHISAALVMDEAKAKEFSQKLKALDRAG